jgi:moderate conductance mechanosensitive channel
MTRTEAQRHSSLPLIDTNTLLANGIAALAAFLTVLGFGLFTLAVFFVLGRMVAWLIWRVAVHRARLRHQPLTERRSATIRALARSVLDGASVILTVVFLLSLFVEPGVLVASLGLFSAGLGFAAKNFISDVFMGISLLVNDRVALGEKVEIGERQTIGYVERITLMETYLRGQYGELWVVPNGEIRTIRNLSRGTFSPADIKLVIPTHQLAQGIAALDAVISTPNANIVGEPEIISEDGMLGQTTILMLKVQARYGMGARVRRELLTQLHKEMAERQIMVQPEIVEDL